MPNDHPRKHKNGKGDGIADPEKGLKAGRKAVPALKYAYGLVGIAGAATTIIGYFKSPQVGVAAILLTLVGMILVWLVSGLTKDTKQADPAARVMVWAAVGLFVAGVILLLTLATLRLPKTLADWLGMPAIVQAPTADDQQKIAAIFAIGAAQPLEATANLHEDSRKALIFIDGHTNAYCEKSTDAIMRQKMQCPLPGSTPVIATSLPVPAAITLQRATQPPASPCSNTALAKVGEPAKIFGFDVTSHNTSIDWTKLVADGYYFVFIKASQGTSFVDARFKDNWDAAGRAGLIRGAYHFFTTADAKLQASNFLTVLKGVVLGPCDVGAALDLENPNFIGPTVANQTPAERVKQARLWLQEVRTATGKPPVLYVAERYLGELGDPSDFAENPLWIASYSPNLPASRARYKFWQFSDGSVGPRLSPYYSMDMNLFNGSSSELFALAK
jgi:lysozyme